MREIFSFWPVKLVLGLALVAFYAFYFYAIFTLVIRFYIGDGDWREGTTEDRRFHRRLLVRNRNAPSLCVLDLGVDAARERLRFDIISISRRMPIWRSR